EVPAMPVRPLHHRRDTESISLISLHFYCHCPLARLTCPHHHDARQLAAQMDLKHMSLCAALPSHAATSKTHLAVPNLETQMTSYDYRETPIRRNRLLRMWAAEKLRLIGYDTSRHSTHHHATLAFRSDSRGGGRSCGTVHPLLTV